MLYPVSVTRFKHETEKLAKVENNENQNYIVKKNMPKGWLGTWLAYHEFTDPWPKPCTKLQIPSFICKTQNMDACHEWKYEQGGTD